MKNSVISIKNISFNYYNNKVLENINLNIFQGDYFGIIGPNGGGKTTLLKIILGLINNFEGEIKIFDKDIKTFRDWPKIGYVPQRFIQNTPKFPITVFEVIGLGLTANLKIGEKFSKIHEKKLVDTLNTTRLFHLKDKLISELSGGQQQLVYIARALVSDPQILILDEPMVGIDIESQENFYNFLQTLNKQRNITLIIVSHDIDLLLHEVKKVACINKTLICDLQPKEFIKDNYLEKIYGKSRRFLLHNH